MVDDGGDGLSFDVARDHWNPLARLLTDDHDDDETMFSLEVLP